MVWVSRGAVRFGRLTYFLLECLCELRCDTVKIPERTYRCHRIDV